MGTSSRFSTNINLLKPDSGDNVSAYFNRGILSTQSLVHQIPKSGTANPDVRKSLAGDVQD
jgi:hypothetical protein